MSERRTARAAIVIGAVIALVALAACQRIGGASNTFGNDPTRAGVQPGYWAAINGPYTNHHDGDPIATRCAGFATSATTCDAAGANPTYDTIQYLWGIDVPAEALGSPMTVAIYDPAHGASAVNRDYTPSQGFATSYRLFDTTGSDALDLGLSHGMDALGRCDAPTPGYHVFAPGSESQGAWYVLCTFTPTVAGTYPLQVKSSAIPGVTDAGSGWNTFAIRAQSSAEAQPTVAGLGRSSLYIDPVPSTSSRLYLVSVDPSQAGKTLAIDLYDPGDGTAGSSPMSLQVLAPPGGVPAVRPTGGTTVPCAYNAVGAGAPGAATPNTSANCLIMTTPAGSSSSMYNNRWLRISITIPADYACTADCWWTLVDNIGSGATSTDRLVTQLTIS